MQAVASTETREKRVVRPGGTERRVDYLGSPGVIDAGPQAFLVDRPYPGARIDPHFHDIDQFQVVVEGGCRMGRRPAGPVTFQYADAYTPYGPIVGADGGFAFFTLRPVASGGYFAMPGNGHRMPCRAGRNIAGRFDIARPRPAPGGVVCEDLMARQADGVDALGLRLGAGAVTGGVASDGGGQYYLVCEGDVTHAGKRLPRRSLIHVAPGETPPVLEAGPDGADILVVQFARPSDRSGSDPARLATRDPGAYVQRPRGEPTHRALPLARSRPMAEP